MSTTSVNTASTPTTTPVAPVAKKDFMVRAGEMKDRAVSVISANSLTLKKASTALFAVAAIAVGIAAIVLSGGTLGIVAGVLSFLAVASGVGAKREYTQIKLAKAAAEAKQNRDALQFMTMSKLQERLNAHDTAKAAVEAEAMKLTTKHKIARAVGFISLAAISAFAIYPAINPVTAAVKQYVVPAVVSAATYVAASAKQGFLNCVSSNISGKVF